MGAGVTYEDEHTRTGHSTDVRTLFTTGPSETGDPRTPSPKSRPKTATGRRPREEECSVSDCWTGRETEAILPPTSLVSSGVEWCRVVSPVRPTRRHLVAVLGRLVSVLVKGVPGLRWTRGNVEGVTTRLTQPEDTPGYFHSLRPH